MSRVKYAYRFYHSLWRIRSEYSAVFVHMNPEYVLLGGLLWRLTGKHTALWYVHKSVDTKLRLAEKLVRVIFTVSRESFRLQSGKVRMLGHGIDTQQFSPPAERQGSDVLRILSAGRISPTKDYETLLRACAHLDVPYRLRIVGAPATQDDASYETALHACARTLGIADRTTFAGPVSHEQMPAELANADVFVNLSKTGSIDKAVLEAMSAEVLPVTANEAFDEMLPPALRVKPEAPEELAGALTTLASQSAAARRTQAAALREYVLEWHSIAALIPAILETFNRV